MAIGLILGGLASAVTKAYQQAAEKKRKQSTSNASTTTKTNSNTKKTSSGNEHQDYINSNYDGGLDAYTKLQNDRYNQALSENNVELLNKLNADAKKVGYTLSSNQVAQEVANPYEDYIKDIEAKYANQANQIELANNAAVKQGVNNLNNQKLAVNQNYDDVAKQAYIMSMQNKKALPQQLAASGVNGGASETAMLGLTANYENNLNKINTGRSNAINEIDSAIANLKNEGELSTAEQVIQNNQAALTAYQNMLNNSANYNQWLTNFNANREDTQYNRDVYDKETATAQKQQEYNNILNRLGMGLISENDAVALGVPAADVQAYVNRLIAAQNADLANTVSNTNKNNTSKTSQDVSPITTADKYLAQGNREKAIAALASIYTSAQIKAYLENNGYRTDDIDWGIDEGIELSYREPTNPALNIETMAAFLKSQGLSNEEIAQRLSR